MCKFIIQNNLVIGIYVILACILKVVQTLGDTATTNSPLLSPYWCEYIFSALTSIETKNRIDG
jgi:hypothetical protein